METHRKQCACPSSPTQAARSSFLRRSTRPPFLPAGSETIGTDPKQEARVSFTHGGHADPAFCAAARVFFFTQQGWKKRLPSYRCWRNKSLLHTNEFWFSSAPHPPNSMLMKTLSEKRRRNKSPFVQIRCSCNPAQH